MKDRLEAIRALLEDASDKAVDLVKDEARKILIADPELEEFIMAMGSCFFTAKKLGKYDALSYTDEEFDELSDSGFEFAHNYGMIDEEHDMYKDFFDMVGELNSEFKVCGYPVRFKADTKEVHDWGDTTKNPVVYEKLDELDDEVWGMM